MKQRVHEATARALPHLLTWRSAFVNCRPLSLRPTGLASHLPLPALEARLTAGRSPAMLTEATPRTSAGRRR